ncbi:MAG: hypothetical protein AAFV53_35485, partial [Myxococcota bacterium]
MHLLFLFALAACDSEPSNNNGLSQAEAEEIQQQLLDLQTELDALRAEQQGADQQLGEDIAALQQQVDDFELVVDATAIAE